MAISWLRSPAMSPLRFRPFLEALEDRLLPSGVAVVNMMPSILGQALMRLSSVPINRAVSPSKVNTPTTGPALVSATNSAPAINILLKDVGAGHKGNGEATVTAENAMPVSDPMNPPMKTDENEQPKGEEPSPFNLVLEDSTDEMPVRLQTLDAVFVEVPAKEGEPTSSEVGVSLVAREPENTEQGAIWVETGLMLGVVCSRREKSREDEEAI